MDHEIVERYRSRWVAIGAHGDVVADAADLAGLLELLESTGAAGTTIQRIPGVDDPLVLGLG